MVKKKTRKQTKSQDSKFYFDDCPVCQAMREAEENNRELTALEVKEAFEKAKKKGAIVGEFGEPTNKRAD